MQSVLIDDRRIHVDFSQSVSKLHKDWISKRMQAAAGQSMGGFDDLQKRTRYRAGDGKQRGENYDLVFDEEPKRHRSEKPSSSSGRSRRRSKSPDSGHRHRSSKHRPSTSDRRERDHRSDRDHRSERDYRSDRDKDRRRDDRDRRSDRR